MTSIYGSIFSVCFRLSSILVTLVSVECWRGPGVGEWKEIGVVWFRGRLELLKSIKLHCRNLFLEENKRIEEED